MNPGAHNRSLFLAVVLALALNVTSYAETEGDYTYIVSDNVATITDFNSSYSGALSITNMLGGCQVAYIGDYAFYSCTNRFGGYQVASIGGGAFQSCGRLTRIAIPNSVTSIGTFAFDGCSGLTSITIPASVTAIGPLTFAGCTSLTNIVIPASVTRIGNIGVR